MNALGYYVPAAGPHDGHTLVFTADRERPWRCEECRASLTDDELEGVR